MRSTMSTSSTPVGNQILALVLRSLAAMAVMNPGYTIGPPLPVAVPESWPRARLSPAVQARRPANAAGPIRG